MVFIQHELYTEGGKFHVHLYFKGAVRVNFVLISISLFIVSYLYKYYDQFLKYYGKVLMDYALKFFLNSYTFSSR